MFTAALFMTAPRVEAAYTVRGKKLPQKSEHEVGKGGYLLKGEKRAGKDTEKTASRAEGA